jgi:anti-anti-sigma regulatory factor
MSESFLHPAITIKDGLLTIKPRVPFQAHSPLVVDLQGVFNRMTAKKLKKRIKVHLKENMGDLAINFSGITSAERDALLLFLKKLRGNNGRIKIISIDSLQPNIDEVNGYAKNYFEVFMDVEDLRVRLA